jgi:pyruvate/oxaloacetate carboxyltransferase
MEQPIDLTIRVTYPKRYPDKEVDVLKFKFEDKFKDLDYNQLKKDIKSKIKEELKEEIDWEVQALAYLEYDKDGKNISSKYIRNEWDLLTIPSDKVTLAAYVEEKGKPFLGGKRNKKSNRQRNSKKNRKSRRRRL